MQQTNVQLFSYCIMIRHDNDNIIFTINSYVIYSMIQMIKYRIVNVVMIIGSTVTHFI